MKTKKNKAALHGECVIMASEIPAGAQKIKVGSYLKIADSETTGNHHIVENAEGCEFYELDGIRYMKNPQPTFVKCVHGDRHDSIEIEPGEWTFFPQKEYDYLTESLRNVAD